MQTEALATVTIGDCEYQVYPINAILQFHINRRLLPLAAQPIVKLWPTILRMLGGDVDEKEKVEVFAQVMASLPDFAKELAALSDEDANYVIFNCLDHCYRKQERGWAKVRSGGVMMFADLDWLTIMRLVIESLKANLSPVFTTGPLKASAAGPLQ
jgi:hypothetical protein